MGITLEELLKEIPVHWDDYAEGMTPSEMANLAREADRLATTAAEMANQAREADRLATIAAGLSAYLEARGGGGKGDGGHEAGIKAKNAAEKRVRKALGYNA